MERRGKELLISLGKKLSKSAIQEAVKKTDFTMGKG